ncbi:MAG TPA: hypothetical protein VG733_14215 [Chthoniobacteraceae bacterium]|nr:hypothetical protein [Chthoniobacteraceae bacterium]
MRAKYNPARIDPAERSSAIDFGSATRRRRSVEETLARLTAAAAYSDYIYYLPVGLFHHGRDAYRLARYIFLGPASGDEPIKLAIFAGLDGRYSESIEALVEFLLRLELEPIRARGYQIFVYPICNPTGFEDATRETRRGHDLARELWNGSRQPEAYYLERELGVLQFHGVITLGAGTGFSGLRARSSSPVLDAALVAPAIDAAEKYLACNPAGDHPFPAATAGRERYEWGLVNPAELNTAPFELTFETARSAPPVLQVKAAVAALGRVLAEYRPFLAARQNI